MNLVHLRSKYNESDSIKFEWVLTGDGLLFLGNKEFIHVYKGFEFMYCIRFDLVSVYVADKNIIYVNGYFYYLSCDEYEYYLVILNLNNYQQIKKIKLNTIYYPWISKIHYYNELIYIMIDTQILSFDLDGNNVNLISDVPGVILYIRDGIIYNIEFNNIYNLHMFELNGKLIKQIEIPERGECHEFYKGVLHLGGAKQSLIIVNNNIQQINYSDNVYKYMLDRDGNTIIRLNRTTYLCEFNSMLIKVDNYEDISILKDYTVVDVLRILSNGSVVKIFEYLGRLYIATTTGFYIYGEYYPHLRPTLPPTQKLKTNNWMQIRPIVQKDIHFLFERELLK